MNSEAGGTVIWLFGLSGAGKSTLCKSVQSKLLNEGRKTVVLDGDDMRRTLCSDLGFELAERAENVRRIAHVAKILSSCGVTVLVATISPLAEFRQIARQILPDVIEIFIDAPLSVCEARDPKGLYQLARRNLLSEFTGISSPFERPTSTAFACRTDIETVETSTNRILRILSEISTTM